MSVVAKKLVGKWMTGASLQARKVDSSLLLMTDGTFNEALEKEEGAV